jgi:serine/threonine protein kinase
MPDGESAQEAAATERLEVKEANEIASSPQEPGVGASSEDLTPDALGHDTDLARLREGEVLASRFVVVRLLAKGGMGAVYEAHDSILRARVALKLIRSDLSDDAIALDRFRREVLLGRQVSHPNVCRVYELYETLTTSGLHVRFLTMELLSGETLSQRLARVGRLATREALPLVQQMCAGLAAAHRAGVIHRDFKSSNVMLAAAPGDSAKETPPTRVVLTDFGVARALENSEGSDQPRLTGEAGVLGTPDYMAPEQVTGAEVTQAADIYALGVVLYEMVTGRLPFSGSSPLASAARRLDEAPPRPELLTPGLDRQWSKVILRCLAREPRHRFRSALDVAAALGKSPRSWKLLALSGLTLLALATVVTARLLQPASGPRTVTTQSPTTAATAPSVDESSDSKPLSGPREDSKRLAPVPSHTNKSHEPGTPLASTSFNERSASPSKPDEERTSAAPPGSPSKTIAALAHGEELDLNPAFQQGQERKTVAPAAPRSDKKRTLSTAPATGFPDEGAEPNPPLPSMRSRDDSPILATVEKLQKAVEQLPAFSFESHCQDIDDQKRWSYLEKFTRQTLKATGCHIRWQSVRYDNDKAQAPVDISIKLDRITGLRFASAEDFLRTLDYKQDRRRNCSLTPGRSGLVVETTSGNSWLVFPSLAEAKKFATFLEAASRECGGLDGRNAESDSKVRKQLRDALKNFYTYSYASVCKHLDTNDEWTYLNVVRQENARVDGCFLRWHFARTENTDVRWNIQKELDLTKVVGVDPMPLEDYIQKADAAAGHRWRCSVVPSYSMVQIRADRNTDRLWLGFRSAEDAETFASALKGVARECGGLKGK